MSEVPVLIYSKAGCHYCDRAKDLFESLGIPFKEVRADLDPVALKTMLEKSGRRSFPQIFIHDKPVGGFDDVVALHQKAALLPLVQGENA